MVNTHQATGQFWENVGVLRCWITEDVNAVNFYNVTVNWAGKALD
jgi:hypothetical protein